MDECGYHLSKCPLGGWRTNRHDDMNAEVGFGIREAGNKATWTDPCQLLPVFTSDLVDKELEEGWGYYFQRWHHGNHGADVRCLNGRAKV